MKIQLMFIVLGLNIFLGFISGGFEDSGGSRGSRAYADVHGAAAKGDLAGVKTALAQGAEVDATKDQARRTALIEAAASGHADVVQHLLDAGASIDQTDARGRTALNEAAYNNHVGVAKLLLKRGANPNEYAHPAHPPFTAACLHPDLEIARILIKAGAFVNSTSPVGWTALHEVAHRDQPRTIAFLVKAGADVSQPNIYGQTPLMIAAQRGKMEAAVALLDAGADPSENNGRISAITEALEGGHFEVAQLLAEVGGELKFGRTYRKAPLYHVVRAGKLELAKRFVELGAPVPTYESGVYESAENGHIDCVRFLFTKGAKLSPGDWKRLQESLPETGKAEMFVMLLRRLFINAPESDPESPRVKPIQMTAVGVRLIEASAAGDLAQVRSLLPTVSDSDFQAVEFAYFFAQQEGWIDVLRAMQSVHKDTSRKLKVWTKQQEALLRACERGETEKVRQLLSEGVVAAGVNAERASPMQKASWGGHAPIVQLLIDAGASAKHFTGSVAHSPLYSAAYGGHLDVVKVLLKAGVDPNHRCPGDIFSAVSVAAGQGHAETVRLLLDRGAKIDDRNYDQSTALMNAAENGNTEMVTLLLKRGASPALRDRDGQTAMSLAHAKGHEEVVKLIAKKAGVDPGIMKAVDPKALINPLIEGYRTPSPERVRELLKAGADPNQPAVYKSPYVREVYPLQLPIYSGQVTSQKLEVVRLLLNAGANPNKPIGLLARVAGNSEEGLEVVRLLVKAGANINGGDAGYVHGASPLAVAALMGDADHVKLLLELGADPTLVDNVGRTAITITRESSRVKGIKRTRIIKLLEKAVEDWDRKYPAAVTDTNGGTSGGTPE